MSVGRMFADAIRRAGVRWAFTVPGESFLGLLEGLEAVGINIVATRHEAQRRSWPGPRAADRAAGRLHRDARGWSDQSRDRHPRGLCRLEPDVRLRGPGGAGRARGREGFQEIDVTETVGRLAKWSAEPTDVTSAVEAAGQAVEQALERAPGRWSCRCPRISSTTRSRRASRRCWAGSHRRGPPTTRFATSSTSSPVRSGR